MAALPVFLLLCLAATGLCEPLHKRIINGNHAELYSHPYIVSLQTYGRLSWSSFGWSHICGGSLISRDWVLTAAHCVDTIRSNQLGNIRVEMGALNLYLAPNSYEQTVGVAQIIVHSGWNGDASGMPNDIALIKLSTPANLNNNVKIASLAEQGADFLGEECVLAGWGMTSTGDNGQLAETLKEVEITKISTSACNSHWRGGITDFHICVHDATPPEGSRPSACMGDSGGPMMCGSGHNVLAGVTSWGESTCSGDLPSVYTRVSKYRDWIYQYARV